LLAVRRIDLKAMSSRIEGSDPLSSAIGALREELLRWIDAELVRLRELPRPADSLTEQALDVASRVRFRDTASRPSACRTGEGREPGVTEPVSWTRERPADGDLVVEAARPAVAPAGSHPEPESKTPPLSPRERLDALARLLDRRLMQAQGAAEIVNGAEIEPG
jgi:hypothetical protein